MSGLSRGVVDGTGVNNVQSVNFIWGVKRDNAKLLYGFGVKVEDMLDCFITGQWAGYLATFEVIKAAFGADLFEGIVA